MDRQTLLICRGAMARETVSLVGDSGYILNSVHNIQPEVPLKNVVAMYDEGRNYVYRK
jgi:uroporphyrinogen-III decarboxylase|tara:strand:- start:197 stop:370 length:174 start_codon:yes stop_codon:yes gene_type:complete